MCVCASGGFKQTGGVAGTGGQLLRACGGECWKRMMKGEDFERGQTQIGANIPLKSKFSPYSVRL